MFGFVIAFLVGVLCVGLGISNRKGNIESLHSYHRHRVAEEDRLPFGKRVGLGTILMGVSIMLFSVLSVVSVYMDIQILVIIGTVVMIVGMVAGSIIAFAAMIKYNKGIF